MNQPFYASLAWLLAASPALTTQAQQPAAPVRPRPFQISYLRLSLGTTYTLGWEYRCPRLALEYAPMLTRHLGLATRLVGVAGRPTAASALYGPWITQVPNQHYHAGFMEGEGLLYPFGNTGRVRFALGAGGYAGYYQLSSVTEANTVSGQLQSYRLVAYQGGRAGYLYSLNLELALGKQRNWLVGLKATRQRGLGGITNLPGQSLTLAHQL